MKPYRVLYSPEAQSDLSAIYSYLAFSLHAKTAAKTQIDRIRKEARSLSFFPERYEQVSWEPWRDYRKVPVDNYVIFYHVDHSAQCVEVIRIFYGGQDIEGIANGLYSLP